MTAEHRFAPGSGELWLVLLAVLCGMGWVLSPAFVRHQAAVEPLVFETVAIEGAEPAGGHALRAAVPDPPAGYPWGARFLEVRENGLPLERARPAAVRREGGGRFAVGQSGEILFAPAATRAGKGEAGDAGVAGAGAAVPPLSSAPAASSERLERLSVRRPCLLERSTVTATLAAFAVANLCLAVFVVRGLARARVLGPVGVWVPVALVGWIVAAAGIEAASDWTGSDLLGQKMDRLLDEVDRYDAVFIGSSRVYRQLEPDTFDRVFAAAGVPMRSYNLGVPDMRMLEVLFLVRWLLEAEPERLGLLVIDAEEDPLFIREENLLADRIVRWHDWRNFVAIAGEHWRRAPGVAAGFHRIARHAVPFAHHATHLGRGLERVRARFAPRPPEAPPAQRGFFAGDEEMVVSPDPAQRAELEMFHGRLHDDLPRFHRDLARLVDSPRAGELTDPFEIELFRELQEMASSRGVELVFLVDPRPHRTPNLVWAAENGVVETLLRFDDPERYPELYDPALRFDRHHVSRAGAELYTAEVARRILGSSRRES